MNSSCAIAFETDKGCIVFSEERDVSNGFVRRNVCCFPRKYTKLAMNNFKNPNYCKGEPLYKERENYPHWNLRYYIGYDFLMRCSDPLREIHDGVWIKNIPDFETATDELDFAHVTVAKKIAERFGQINRVKVYVSSTKLCLEGFPKGFVKKSCREDLFWDEEFKYTGNYDGIEFFLYQVKKFGYEDWTTIARFNSDDHDIEETLKKILSMKAKQYYIPSRVLFD